MRPGELGGKHVRLRGGKLGIDVAAHVIGPAREYQDLYEDWARAHELGEDGCVLVRPDMHVAWRRTVWPTTRQRNCST